MSLHVRVQSHQHTENVSQLKSSGETYLKQSSWVLASCILALSIFLTQIATEN